MRYCDSCLDNPAKKKITPDMAKLLGLDPHSKVCATCFDSLALQVKAIK